MELRRSECSAGRSARLLRPPAAAATRRAEEGRGACSVAAGAGEAETVNSSGHRQ